MRRILANVIPLYARQAVLTVADFLCLRLTLSALGLEGCGLFFAAAEVASVFSFFHGALQNAFQRFFGIALGRHDRDGLVSVFASALGLSVLLAGGVLFVGGCLGGGYAAVCLSVPEGSRATALAIFALQLTIILLRTLQIPFSAMVVACERMRFYARLSLLEGLLSLGAPALVLWLSPGSILLFAALLTGAVLTTAVVCAVYCLKLLNRPVVPEFKPSRLRELNAFFWWSALGSVAGLLKTQGIALLVNAAAGVVASAALTAAMKVAVALWTIITNFRLAYQPTVVQAWAVDDRTTFLRTTAFTFRVSAVAMGAISLLLAIYAPELTSLWLGCDKPPLVDAFIRCIAVQFFFEAMATPLDTAILTIGRIVRYMCVQSVIIGAAFPIAAICLWFGAPLWTSVGSVALVTAVAFFYRIAFLCLHNDADGCR